jgi:hypothetical protein
VPLEWVYFFIFQIYDWVVNFPLLKFNIWRFSSYDKVKNWSVYLLWILVWISECATNKSDCHNITELQSMTLGFGTYKPFGPVHMRTLLARIHIHWPESKLTKSHINWKKVMKSDPWYHMFILLIKKNIWVSLFGAPPVCSPYPHHCTPLHLHSAPCHILVHVKSARLNTPLACHYVQAFTLLEGNRSKRPHFFQNNNYFTKMACLIIKKILLKRWYHTCCDVL